MLVCVCVYVCVCVCVCACARACARALRIVSMDKILRFTNTLIIINFVPTIHVLRKNKN